MNKEITDAVKLLHNYCCKHISCASCLMHYKDLLDTSQCAINTTPSHYKLNFINRNIKALKEKEKQK